MTRQGDVAVRLYFRYWGKAKPGQAEEYHLLPYHCLDVAAVGYRLLESEELGRRLAEELGLSTAFLQALFVWALALHDIGKFARSFQNLAPNLSVDLVSAIPSKSLQVRHDSLGFLLWQESLAEGIRDNGFVICRADDPGLERLLENLSLLMQVATGHHGVPPDTGLDLTSPYFEDEDIAAGQAFYAEVTNFFLSDFADEIAVLTHPDLNETLKKVSWKLAGLAVFADWLGSNQDIFKYTTAPMKLSDYWRDIALLGADKALALTGKGGSLSIAPYLSLQNLFPFIDRLTPLQRFAESVPIMDGPQLFILEDVTGAGKTEAALTLTHRLLAAGRGRGLYVALPTMATANAMYQRMGSVYRKLFTNNCSPSLVLAHGGRNLSPEFRQSVALSEQGGDLSYGQDEPSASAFCNAWLADSRKKALLAEVGVGTLDQALLSVLPVRHQSLRVLGLADKVLLVDEVHAYDPYMNRLLRELLRFHAESGGSAVLLSATIPFAIREKLVAAYVQGVRGATPDLRAVDYPLVTQVARSAFNEAAVATRESVRRQVFLERLDKEEDALELVLKEASSGACVCWIRNTVKDALRAYELLKKRGLAEEKTHLFHSRFAMIDRQRIEREVLNLFGADSTHDQRKGRVLLATQVVEQSLDLDFDVLVSDIAPVDLIIQRAGRLRRHIRDVLGNRLKAADAQDQRGKPVLYLLAPEPVTDADENWLNRVLPGTQAVYQHVGQLWLTAKKLFERKSMRMPDDARALIEGVYGESAQEVIPAALLPRSLEAVGVRHGQLAMAGFNVLRLQDGYTRLSANGKWSKDVDIATRITGDTVSVALVKVADGEILPYAEDKEYAWALSQLSVPKSVWDALRKTISEDATAIATKAKERYTALKWVEVFPLVGELTRYYDQSEGFRERERE